MKITSEEIIFIVLCFLLVISIIICFINLFIEAYKEDKRVEENNFFNHKSIKNMKIKREIKK